MSYAWYLAELRGGGPDVTLCKPIVVFASRCPEDPRNFCVCLVGGISVRMRRELAGKLLTLGERCASAAQAELSSTAELWRERRLLLSEAKPWL